MNKNKKPHKSVANKISQVVIILSISIFIVTGYIINDNVTEIVRNMVKKELMVEADLTASQINEFFTEKAQIVKLMAQSESIYKYIKASKGIKDRQKVKQIEEYKDALNTFKNINNRDEDVSLVYTALKDNNSFVSDNKNYTVPKEFDLNQKGWYTNAVSKGATHITCPYIDGVTGELVISAVEPIYENGKDIGATAIDVSIKKLSEILSSINISKDAKLMLIDAKGTIVYHTDKEKIMKENILEQEGHIAEIGKKMLAGERGASEYKIKKSNKYVSYSPINTSNWSIGIYVPNSYIK